MATPLLWLWSGVRRCFQHRRTPLQNSTICPSVLLPALTVYIPKESMARHFCTFAQLAANGNKQRGFEKAPGCGSEADYGRGSPKSWAESIQAGVIRY